MIGRRLMQAKAGDSGIDLGTIYFENNCSSTSAWTVTETGDADVDAVTYDSRSAIKLYGDSEDYAQINKVISEPASAWWLYFVFYVDTLEVGIDEALRITYDGKDEDHDLRIYISDRYMIVRDFRFSYEFILQGSTESSWWRLGVNLKASGKADVYLGKGTATPTLQVEDITLPDSEAGDDLKIRQQTDTASSTNISYVDYVLACENQPF